MGRHKGNKDAKQAKAKPEAVAPAPAVEPRHETVTERLRREAREEAEREAAKLAAERDAAERARIEREKREREAAEKRRIEAAQEAKRREDARRQNVIAKAARDRKKCADMIERLERSYTHAERILAAIAAYDEDMKAGRAQAIGYVDFEHFTADLNGTKEIMKVDLLNQSTFLSARLGKEHYRNMQANFAEAAALEKSEG